MKYESQLLTRAEAAEYLGVKEDTLAVWACLNRYNLPMIKVGRSVRYKKSHLDEFIEKRTIVPEEVPDSMELNEEVPESIEVNEEVK